MPMNVSEGAPMVQNLLNLFIERLGPSAPTLAVALAAGGAFLWLLGARFSRSIFALIGVGVGAWVGLQLPRWYGWHFDGMALSIGAAIALGVAGYLLQTTWIGLLLCVQGALLFAVAAWFALAGDATWNVPVLEWAGTHSSILNAIWRSMPGDLPRVMPYAVAGGAISGAVVSLLWPRAARVSAFVSLGLLLFVTFGIISLQLCRPQWVGMIPTGAGAVALLAGMAVLGALVQWWTLPTRPATPTPPLQREAREQKAAMRSQPAPMKFPPPPQVRAIAGRGSLATGGLKA